MGISSLIETLIKTKIESERLEQEEKNRISDAERTKILASFGTYDALLTYLASAPHKERQVILRHWETQTPTKKIGRKKKEKYNREYLLWFIRMKARYEIKRGKELSDKMALELYYQENHPEKKIDEWRKGFKTILNALVKLRQEIDSSQ